MNELPATSPHFIGLFAAVALAGAATIVLTRRAVVARLGDARPWVVVAITVPLLGLAYYGSGVSGSAGRGQAFSATRLHSALPFSEESVESARNVALSPRFLAYAARLEGEALAFTPESLSACVTWSWVADPAAAAGLPAQVAPPGAQALVYSYEDTGNPFLALLGVGAVEREQRRRYLEALANDYLIDLVNLEYVRGASTEEARVAALTGIRFGVPMIAEWILADLATMEPRLTSDTERAALTETRAYVQRYVDDSTLRALPAHLRVSVD